MSIDQNEADATALVQKLVNYAMNLGFRNTGPEWLLLSAAEIAVDLCTHSDMFEDIEPEKIQPYIEVWRQMKIAEADMAIAAGTQRRGTTD